MQRLQVLFDRFLRVRVYVNNITPATRSEVVPRRTRTSDEGLDHVLFRPGGVAAAEVLILAVRAKPE